MTIERNDQDIYDEVGAAFGNVSAPAGPGAAIARGRTLRRRHRTMPALATAGVVAVSLGLATLTQTSAPAHTAADGAANGTTKPNTVAVNVQDAAFSVYTDAKTGLVTITVKEFEDQDKLKQALSQAGISAVFHTDTVTPAVGKPFKEFCTWTGAKSESSSKVITQHAPVLPVISSITIDPAAMPAGSVLGFDYTTVKSTGSAAQVTVPGPAVEYSLLSGQPTGCTI
jgi:hypothetical protein